MLIEVLWRNFTQPPPPQTPPRIQPISDPVRMGDASPPLHPHANTKGPKQEGTYQQAQQRRQNTPVNAAPLSHTRKSGLGAAAFHPRGTRSSCFHSARPVRKGGKAARRKPSRGLKAKALQGGGIHILLTSGDAAVSRKASSSLKMSTKVLVGNAVGGSGGRTPG